MARKSGFRKRDPDDNNFRRTLWFRSKIRFLLREGPLSQTALFVGLARLSGRPHPETRGHPNLVDSAAALALKELMGEGIVEKSVNGRRITFYLVGKSISLVKGPKSIKGSLTRLPQKTSGIGNSPADDKRIDQIEAKISGLEKRVDGLLRRMDDFDQRRESIIKQVERSLAEVGASVIVGEESS